ncbi:hypothetical protein C2845_PM11G19610 [Panicum miliaceum]|uniref:Uncharacterized protein n=1 Tax=Panicum miliaceum TaxID=4540 RepID=A0A3L6RPF1_PANMI|nr:hypothetical protein C2845_PM11G19610 [Panicum miliaceum]
MVVERRAPEPRPGCRAVLCSLSRTTVVLLPRARRAAVLRPPVLPTAPAAGVRPGRRRRRGRRRSRGPRGVGWALQARGQAQREQRAGAEQPVREGRRRNVTGARRSAAAPPAFLAVAAFAAMVRRVCRPSRTALGTWRMLLDMSVAWLVSTAAADPDRPMESPTSAKASAGALFMPSPTISVASALACACSRTPPSCSCACSSRTRMQRPARRGGLPGRGGGGTCRPPLHRSAPPSLSSLLHEAAAELLFGRDWGAAGIGGPRRSSSSAGIGGRSLAAPDPGGAQRDGGSMGEQGRPRGGAVGRGSGSRPTWRLARLLFLRWIWRNREHPVPIAEASSMPVQRFGTLKATAGWRSVLFKGPSADSLSNA